MNAPSVVKEVVAVMSIIAALNARRAVKRRERITRREEAYLAWAGLLFDSYDDEDV